MGGWEHLNLTVLDRLALRHIIVAQNKGPPALNGAL